MGAALMVFLVYAMVVILLFFVTRMFWLWYFKLDRIEEHLAAISSALKLMTRETVARDAVEKKTSEERANDDGCPGCGAGITGKEDECPSCGLALNAQSNVCPKCAVSVHDEAIQCGSCGQDLR